MFQRPKCYNHTLLHCDSYPNHFIPFICRFSKGLPCFVFFCFISSRLDYGNSVYSGVCRCNIQTLRLIQYAVARLSTHAIKEGTILCQYLLPFTGYLWVLELIFKSLLLVFIALNEPTLAFRCDLLTVYEPDCCLRSSNRVLVMVPYHYKRPGLYCSGPSAMKLPVWRSQTGKLNVII